MMVCSDQSPNTIWCPYLDMLYEDLFIKTILYNLSGIYSLAKETDVQVYEIAKEVLRRCGDK